MATDYIIREAAIKELCAMCQNIDQDEDKDRCWCIPKDRFNQIPAADVVESVEAVWVWRAMCDGWFCSNCGKPADNYITPETLYKQPDFKFCPHCGAVMKEVPPCSS